MGTGCWVTGMRDHAFAPSLAPRCRPHAPNGRRRALLAHPRDPRGTLWHPPLAQCDNLCRWRRRRGGQVRPLPSGQTPKTIPILTCQGWFGKGVFLDKCCGQVRPPACALGPKPAAGAVSSACHPALLPGCSQGDRSGGSPASPPCASHPPTYPPTHPPWRPGPPCCSRPRSTSAPAHRGAASRPAAAGSGPPGSGPPHAVQRACPRAGGPGVPACASASRLRQRASHLQAPPAPARAPLRLGARHRRRRAVGRAWTPLGVTLTRGERRRRAVEWAGSRLWPCTWLSRTLRPQWVPACGSASRLRRRASPPQAPPAPARAPLRLGARECRRRAVGRAWTPLGVILTRGERRRRAVKWAGSTLWPCTWLSRTLRPQLSRPLPPALAQPARAHAGIPSRMPRAPPGPCRRAMAYGAVEAVGCLVVSSVGSWVQSGMPRAPLPSCTCPGTCLPMGRPCRTRMLRCTEAGAYGAPPRAPASQAYH